MRHGLKTRIDTMGFVVALDFKLLNKMTMPPESRKHPLKSPLVGCFIGMGVNILKYLAHAEVAPGDIRRKPTATDPKIGRAHV